MVTFPALEPIFYPHNNRNKPHNNTHSLRGIGRCKRLFCREVSKKTVFFVHGVRFNASNHTKIHTRRVVVLCNNSTRDWSDVFWRHEVWMCTIHAMFALGFANSCLGLVPSWFRALVFWRAKAKSSFRDELLITFNWEFFQNTYRRPKAFRRRHLSTIRRTRVKWDACGSNVSSNTKCGVNESYWDERTRINRGNR